MYSSNNNGNSTSLSEEAPTSTISSVTTTRVLHEFTSLNSSMVTSSVSDDRQQQQTLYPNNLQKIKKKRNLPGNPDPDAQVIALSPDTLMATNRFVCEICNKGFQRDQNLQLHRRGHNLPWKLKQKNNKDEIKKRVYVCPEPSCVHHHPTRALGDLTGIKKHFCRKHGEKKWKCEKCCKIYAVQSDWKAHSKTCGTKQYICDCGTLFSRKDCFITHRGFCDALAAETARLSAAESTHHPSTTNDVTQCPFNFQQYPQHPSSSLFPLTPTIPTWPPNQNQNPNPTHIKRQTSPFYQPSKDWMMMTSPPPASGGFHVSSSHLSATALLQKAAAVGAVGGHVASTMTRLDTGELGHVTTAAGILPEYDIATWQKTESLTRDFLGLTEDQDNHHGGVGGRGDDNNGGVDVSVNVKNMLTYTVGVELPTCDRERELLKTAGFGFAEPTTGSETWYNC